MSDFYDDMRDLANELLTEFNQGTIQHLSITPGTGDADEPGAPTVVTTDLTAAVARGVEYRFATLSHVLESDLQIVIPGGSVEPQPSDYFTINGTRYKIVEISRTPASGTVVKFDVIVRK